MAEQWMAEQYAQIVLPSIVLPLNLTERAPQTNHKSVAIN